MQLTRGAVPLDQCEYFASHISEEGIVLDYDPLEEFHDPQTYDLICDHVREEVPLIERWAPPGSALLDIACGSGRTALPLAARGYSITGVDLVPEMIERGREKATRQELAVEWVVADARSFHLSQRFACAYIAGNAFQMFYTREDQEALLARVREHLLPEGHFILETRNPTPRILYEVWRPESQTYRADDGGELTVAEEQPVYEPMSQIQRYTSHYRWRYADGRSAEQIMRITLRYTFPQELEALLHYNGFAVAARYGSWQQEPLVADSREMILVCRKR